VVVKCDLLVWWKTITSECLKTKSSENYMGLWYVVIWRLYLTRCISEGRDNVLIQWLWSLLESSNWKTKKDIWWHYKWGGLQQWRVDGINTITKFSINDAVGLCLVMWVCYTIKCQSLYSKKPLKQFTNLRLFYIIFFNKLHACVSL
jgi:hypothetical protein